MNAKAAILTAVRAARPSAIPRPDVGSETRAFSAGGGDIARFRAAAGVTGATVVECDRRQLGETTAKAMQGVTHVVSHVPDVPGTMDPPSAPRAYAEVGGFVCEAELGVAENGAVWLTASRLGCRAGLFLATDVVIVLASDAIVANMHAAYQRIDLTRDTFGIFVGGPSKTADIEQAMVVGAHGPVRVTLVITSRAGSLG